MGVHNMAFAIEVLRELNLFRVPTEIARVQAR